MVILWTDALLYVLLGALAISVYSLRSRPHTVMRLKKHCGSPVRISAMVILCAFVLIGTLDSIHYRTGADVLSVLDWLLLPMSSQLETSYSPPFATELFVEHMQQNSDGSISWVKDALIYVSPVAILPRVVVGFLIGFCIVIIVGFLSRKIFGGINRSALVTLFILSSVIAIAKILMAHYHVLGTDKVGTDVLYSSIKSIRTGLIIGTVTTLITLPFAIFLGTAAGYIRGRVDDVIQYIYTTLSSIPGVLLIAAAVLTLDSLISRHDALFSLMAERTDARLLILCTILGVTSWTVLCRVLRGETMKLANQDFILAARVMGISRLGIIWRHIVPNLFHIIIITIALDFSALVLAEAVLSYVGVGVDPSTYSWGNMINSARMQLAREPIIWWPLLGAFSLMFSMVLVANIFADGVRDAFDPRVE